MNNNLIYGLVDPRDGQLRYVGKSTSGMKRPKSEFQRVLSGFEGRGHRCNWILGLAAANLCYKIVVIQEFDNPDILGEAEIFWIAYFRNMGFDLTNITLGGDGASGYRHTDETLSHLREIHKGKRPSAKCLSAANAAVRGSHRSHSEATKAKMSASKLGKSRKPFSDQTKLRMSEGHGGRLFRDQSGEVYTTLSEAQLSTGVDRANISAVLHGRYKQCNGFVFAYLDSEKAAKPEAPPPTVSNPKL